MLLSLIVEALLKKKTDLSPEKASEIADDVEWEVIELLKTNHLRERLYIDMDELGYEDASMRMSHEAADAVIDYIKGET